MGFKFRKSIKVLPGVKINLSKSGVSTTVGVKGLSVNFNKKGTYLNMGIPGTGIYDRKKVSSNTNNVSFSDNKNIYIDYNSKEKSKISNMGIFRKILLYIQRFFASIFLIIFFISLFEGDIGTAIFLLISIILIDFYDFQLIKNKKFSYNKANQEVIVDENADISDKENYNIDDGYDLDNYNILKCENGDILDTQRDNDFFGKLESEKETIYDIYGKLSVEFEEIKQFGEYSKMIDFETKVHSYFSDEVLPKILDLGLIENIEPIKEKIVYDDRHFNAYEYIGKLINKKEFEEFKSILNNRLTYYKQGANDYLYDLYAKSLRRIGNYYKQNKLWKESLNIFTIIEDMGQAGIMDKKSIIKIKKEIG